MSNFGALTDHFGILAIVDGAGTLATKLKLVGASETVDPQSRADAPDENGDIAAATWHGNTDGALKGVSNTFELISGTLDTSLLIAGEVATGKVITTIGVSPSNGGWPTITVSGKLGIKAITAPPLLLNTWKFPAFTLTAAKRAQLFSFTVGAGCRLTDSAVEGTLELAQTEDGLGEPSAHGISGGMLTMTASMVSATGAPTWTVTGDDWTETQVPGAEEGQAAYHTANGAAELVWEREVAPL